jgi:hypothetical protein
MRNSTAKAAEGISLVPLAALVARVFGEEFRPPAKDIGTQDADYFIDNLRPANQIGQERVVQMAVIIVNPAARLGLRINHISAVKELNPLAFPVGLHLLRIHHGERAGKSICVEIFQFRTAEKQLAWSFFFAY